MSYSIKITFSTTTNQDSDLMTLAYLLEVGGVFFDLSKAFDRVQHDGLLYQLKSNGTDVNELLSMLNVESGNWLQLVCRKVYSRPIIFPHLH